MRTLDICISKSKGADQLSVADLEGFWMVGLNPPLGPNYFIFMGKIIMKNRVKC